MKYFKLLSLVINLLIFMSAAVFAQGGFIVKAEADLSGSLEVSKDGGSADMDVKTGFGLSAEYIFNQSQFSYGFGGSFLFARSLEGPDLEGNPFVSDPAFSFIPVYGVVKLNLMPGELVPQIIGHAGYGFFTGNDDFKNGAVLTGGFYWAAGAGLEIGSIVITGIYKVFSGVADSDIEGAFDIKYTTLSLGAGFAF